MTAESAFNLDGKVPIMTAWTCAASFCPIVPMCVVNHPPYSPESGERRGFLLDQHIWERRQEHQGPAKSEGGKGAGSGRKGRHGESRASAGRESRLAGGRFYFLLLPVFVLDHQLKHSPATPMPALVSFGNPLGM